MKRLVSTNYLFGRCWPALLVVLAGCWSDPSAHTFSRDYSLGNAPVDPPHEEGSNHDDIVTGAWVYETHCSRCHNGRPLGERPFAWNVVSATHMREQAYLTGKEYRAVVQFMRRWAEVGPPTPDVEPSPKRFFFSQPMSELGPGKNAANPPKTKSQSDQEVQTMWRLPPVSRHR